MEIINNPTQDEIKKAAKALKDGLLVAFPTETVYGLGADATNEKAISRIYSVKGRPTDHPLIVHISSINQLDKWAIDIPDYAIKLAKEFWPGPMTLILKRSELAEDFITGRQKYVGIRVPAQNIAIALLTEFEKIGGQGIAAPSANRFGALSPTSTSAVNEEIGRYLDSGDLILDGGICKIGLESTIVDCTKNNPIVLRPGSLSIEMIQKFSGCMIENNLSTSKIKSPGLLASHYSPKAKVILDSLAEDGEGFIAMANIPTPNGAHRLASPNNVDEFARDLYEALRNGDRDQINIIKVISPNGGGLAEAIRDRLKKAAFKGK